MSDNVNYAPATTGVPIATDDVGGVQYQRVKLSFGFDGSAVDVSSANPLPVTSLGNVTVVDGGGSLTVDGPLTDAQLRATPVPISGSLSATVSATYNTTPPSLTNGQSAPFQCTAAGELKTVSTATVAGSVAITNVNANGQVTSVNSAPVVPASDWVGTFGGISGVATATVTRPADTTAYASGDLVANSTTAGSVAPLTLALARVNAGTGVIRRVRLKKSGTSVTNASFRVHFYKTSPTATNGDNGVWLTTESNYIGFADVALDKAFSDAAKGSGVPKDSAGNSCDLLFDAAGGTTNIFALIEARAAYTPVSAEVFTLAVEVLKD